MSGLNELYLDIEQQCRVLMLELGPECPALHSDFRVHEFPHTSLVTLQSRDSVRELDDAYQHLLNDESTVVYEVESYNEDTHTDLTTVYAAPVARLRFLRIYVQHDPVHVASVKARFDEITSVRSTMRTVWMRSRLYRITDRGIEWPDPALVLFSTCIDNSQCFGVNFHESSVKALGTFKHVRDAY